MGNNNPNTWLQQIEFRVAGFSLSGRKQPSIHGLYFNKVEGWHGLPDMKGSSHPNPVSQGSLPRTPDQSRRSSRVFTIEGSVIGVDYEDFTAKRRAFMTQMARSDMARVVEIIPVEGSDPRMDYIDASVVSAVFKEDHGKPACKFVLMFEAPDPMKHTDHQVFQNVGDGTTVASYNEAEFPFGGDLEFSIPPESAWASLEQFDVEFLYHLTFPSEFLFNTTFLFTHSAFPGDTSRIYVNPSERRVYRESGNPVQFHLTKEWPALPPVAHGMRNLTVTANGQPGYGDVTVTRSFKVW